MADVPVPFDRAAVLAEGPLVALREVGTARSRAPRETASRLRPRGSSRTHAPRRASRSSAGAACRGPRRSRSRPGRRAPRARVSASAGPGTARRASTRTSRVRRCRPAARRATTPRCSTRLEVLPVPLFPWLPFGGYDRTMPDRLHFTDSDEANVLIATDPFALLVGFVLDQQVSVQKAFAGPLVLKERLGAFDADTLATADLEPVFRERPAVHRYPGSMSKRVHDLAVHVRDVYGGHAERVWTDAADSRGPACQPRGAPGLRGDEDQGARLRARQALRRGGRSGARARASHARRRGLGRRRSPTTRPPSACTRPSGRRRRSRADRSGLVREHDGRLDLSLGY